APPKTSPAGMPSTEDLASQLSPTILPAWLLWLIKNRTILAIVLIVIFVLLAIVTGTFIVFGVLAALTIAGYIYAGKIDVGKVETAEDLLDPAQELKDIQAVPVRPNFALTLSDEETPP